MEIPKFGENAVIAEFSSTSRIWDSAEKYCIIPAMTDELQRRQNLTFSQADGLAELPRPLNLGEMPKAFRTGVWTEIFRFLEKHQKQHGHPPFFPPCETLIIHVWVRGFQRPIDDIPTYPEGIMHDIRNVVMQGPFNRVFDILTVMARSQAYPDLLDVIAEQLREHQMAYYLDTSGPPTFMPQSSPQEGEAVRAAMGVLVESGMGGARAHLQKAAEAINGGQFADAIRESIHAVESVAKVISGNAKTTLKPALVELEKQGLTHKALATGFANLYGYTSDEKGIRHASLGGDNANVGQEEAVFMFGACASFCGYLCRKRAKMSAPVGD